MGRTEPVRKHGFRSFRSRLEVRHSFFSVRVINTWNAIVSKTVENDSLTTIRRLLRQDLDEQLCSFS